MVKEEELESYPAEGEEVVEEGGVELKEKEETVEIEEETEVSPEATEIEEVLEYSKVDPELIEAALVATDLLDALATGRVSADEVIKTYQEKVVDVAESRVVKVKTPKKAQKKTKKSSSSMKSSRKRSRSSKRKSSS